MAFSVSQRTKETPSDMLDTYWAVMDQQQQSPIDNIVHHGHLGQGHLTAVVVKRRNTKNSDIWFYRFPDHAEPVAKLTGEGEYLTLSSYDLAPGQRVIIREDDVHQVLKSMLRTETIE